jgi:hypothetical protein
MPDIPKPNSILKLALATTLCAALLAPAGASADYQRLLLDACGNDGAVNGNYTQSEYRDAIANIPTDADQYSDCRAILTAAQLSAASGGSGSGGGASDGAASSGGSAVTQQSTTSQPSKSETNSVDAAVSDAVKNGGGPVVIGAATVNPDALGASRSISSLPTALIVALALIGSAAIAAILLLIIPRVRAYYAD